MIAAPPTESKRGLVNSLISPHPLGRYLPSLYQEDDFAQRFLSAFDAALAPIFSTLDNLNAYMDPWLAPEDFLDWLASWFGLVLDEAWSVERRRALVANAFEFYRMRGTSRGLKAHVEVFTGGTVEIVDTGGLELDPDDPIEARVQEQAQLAIGEADVILFVVDAMTGTTPADLEAARILRRATAPVIVVVNKADNEKRELEGAEFHALGWEETYAISASHGRGTGDLLDAIVWALPPESEAELARKAREAEAEAWADEVAAGRLEPFVVGDPEAGDADGSDGEGADGAAIDPSDAEARRWDAAMAACSALRQDES